MGPDAGAGPGHQSVSILRPVLYLVSWEPPHLLLTCSSASNKLHEDFTNTEKALGPSRGSSFQSVRVTLEVDADGELHGVGGVGGHGHADEVVRALLRRELQLAGGQRATAAVHRAGARAGA